MPEGDGLDVFLDARRDLGPVAPGVQIPQVRRQRGEQIRDLGPVGGDFCGDGGRGGGLELADAGGDGLSGLRGRVRGKGRGGDGDGGYRWREKILEGDERRFSLVGLGRRSHLLAQGRDVSGCFDDSLTAVVVFVQLGAEGLEHGYEG